MKLLLVSDREEPYIWDYYDRDRFADIDLVISCGDLSAEYLSFIVTMVGKPLFYVPGNHDKAYLKSPPEGCAPLDGTLTEYMGLRMLGLGGSMRYNNGEFQYGEEEMLARVKRLKRGMLRMGGIDMLVTHAPARGLGDGADLCHTGFQCFTDIIDTYKPKYHVHGHSHLEYGKVQRVLRRGETAVINACGYYILDMEKAENRSVPAVKPA